MFISAVKLDILTWPSMGNDSLLEPQVAVRGTVVLGLNVTTPGRMVAALVRIM